MINDCSQQLNGLVCPFSFLPLFHTMSSMLRRPSRMPGQDWSLLLNNSSEDYVVSAADLAPFDPRTQDPNIAPWADIEQEDEEAQVIHLLSPTSSHLSYGC